MNSIVYNQFLDLVFFACDEGHLDICDYRQRKNIESVKLIEDENL